MDGLLPRSKDSKKLFDSSGDSAFTGKSMPRMRCTADTEHTSSGELRLRTAERGPPDLHRVVTEWQPLESRRRLQVFTEGETIGILR